MSPADFKTNRKKLGLSAYQLGEILNTDPRTIRRWEHDDGSRPPNPVAARVMQWMIDGYRPPQWPNAAPVDNTENCGQL